MLFPGQGVPSCMVHPSSGIFCAFATNAFTRTLNSSYSLCKSRRQTQFSIRRPLLSCTENDIVALGETKSFLNTPNWMNANVSMVCVIYLHCPALFHKGWLDLILQVVNLESKVNLGSPWLNVKLLAERHPFPREFRGL